MGFGRHPTGKSPAHFGHIRFYVWICAHLPGAERVRARVAMRGRTPRYDWVPELHCQGAEWKNQEGEVQRADGRVKEEQGEALSLDRVWMRICLWLL